VPAPRASTLARGRHAALVVCVVVLGTAAGCRSTPSATGSPGSSSSTSSTLAAPWQGTLVATGLPDPVQSLQGVSCADARHCWAVGSTVATSTAPSGPVLVASVNGGATWKVQPLPPGIGYLADIACATPRTCTAVGQAGGAGVGPGVVLTTTDAGSAWTSQPVPAGTTDVTAVSCRTGVRCTALGTVAGRVTALTPGGAGGAWVPRGPLPTAASVATSLACTDSLHCWATASDTTDPSHAVGSIDATTDGGTSWIPQTVPAGTGALNAVDCVPPATGSAGGSVTCTAVGTTSTVLNGTRTGQGLVLTSGGGATWSTEPVPPGVADLLDVSCGAGPCVAVGATVGTAAQAGVVVLTPATGRSATIWRRSATVPVALPLTAVSCVSLAVCVVVGESVSARLVA
jgi:hypothetical protein